MRNITFILMILFISVSWAIHLEFPKVPPQVSLKAVNASVMTEADHFDWVHLGSSAVQKLLQVLNS